MDQYTTVGPKKAEDHGWHDMATLERPTDDYHSGTYAEGEFIEAEDNLRKDGGANKWCGHYLLTQCENMWTEGEENVHSTEENC
jgi:hypothetical protein